MLKFRQKFLLTFLSFLLVTHTLVAKDNPSAEVTRFAVIGDYGREGVHAENVAHMVKGWKPDFIVTLGDNNYPKGSADTIDDNIGKYYQAYIHPYKGQHGKGADKNRFFPILGNHDWRTAGAQAYLDYFDLPGNKRYYDFTWGPLHFFALDSDNHEPDGITADSKQAMWLKEKLASSTLPFKVVLLHHPPYSSGHHGSSEELRWPYKEWGATLVMSGHDHDYERVDVDGLHYIVNGLGGQEVRDPFTKPVFPGTKHRFHNEYGAMLVDVTGTQMKCQFITKHGEVIDSFVVDVKPSA
jgi:tartrate-resistant acid phosphatase type 5